MNIIIVDNLEIMMMMERLVLDACVQHQVVKRTRNAAPARAHRSLEFRAGVVEVRSDSIRWNAQTVVGEAVGNREIGEEREWMCA